MRGAQHCGTVTPRSEAARAAHFGDPPPCRGGGRGGDVGGAGGDSPPPPGGRGWGPLPEAPAGS